MKTVFTFMAVLGSVAALSMPAHAEDTMFAESVVGEIPFSDIAGNKTTEFSQQGQVNDMLEKRDPMSITSMIGGGDTTEEDVTVHYHYNGRKNYKDLPIPPRVFYNVR